MSVILDQITIGDLKVLVVDQAPTQGAGLEGAIGSLVMVEGQSGIYQKIGALDTEWKLVSVDAAQLASDLSALDSRLDTLELDPVTKTYVDQEVADLQGQIDLLESGSQAELDATQVGAGLNGDGSYIVPTTSNYLNSSTSLADADSKLDVQIKTVADDLAQEVIDRAADVDAEETARIAEDLTFVKLDGSRAMTGDLDMGSNDIKSVLTVQGPSSGGGSSPTQMLQIDNDGGEINYRSDKFVGQSFTSTQSSALYSVSIDAKTYANITPTGNIYAKIYAADNFGGSSFGVAYPASSNLLATSSPVSASAIGTASSNPVPFGTLTFNFSGFNLVSGTRYVVVFDFKAITSNEGSFTNILLPTTTSGLYTAGNLVKEDLGDPQNIGSWPSDLSITINVGVSSPVVAGPAIDLQTSGQLGFGGAKLVNIADGTSANHAVSKSQLDSEASTRLSADNALDARLDIIEGPNTQAGSIAKALKDANDYTDAEIAALVDSAPALLDTLNELAAALGDDPNFATTIASQIGNIQSELDSTQSGAGLGTDGAYTAPVGSNYLGSAVSLKDADNKLDAQIKIVADGLAQEIIDRAADVDAEETARIAADDALDARIDALELDSVTQAYVDAADAAIQSELDATQVGAGLGTDGSYTAPVGSNYLGSAVSLKDADSKLDIQIKTVADGLAQEIIDRAADVDAEETARIAADDALDLRLDVLELDPVTKTYVDSADNALDARLDIIEGPDTQVGSIAKALKDAKDYTDAEVAALVDGAPALLDTLNELAAALGDDENFSATVATQIGNIQSELDATQTGAGLGSDGSYTAPVGSNYLGSAVSLKDADSKLDAQIKIVADGLAQEIIDRAADVDAEESARISEDLTFVKLDGSRAMTGDLDMDQNDIKNVNDFGMLSNNVAYNAKGSSTSTVSAVNAVVATFSPAADSVELVKIMVTGFDSASNDSVSYERTVRVKNNGGTLSLGTVQSDYTSEDPSLVTANCTFIVNASDIDVRVTGVSGKTITWKCMLQRMR